VKWGEVVHAALWIVSTLVIVVGIGFGIERFRQRGVRKWAAETGASFESGGIIAGVEMPEAGAFDTAPGPGSVSYHDVVRVARDGPSYALAWVHRSGSDIRGQQRSSESLEVFVTCPGAAFPHVRTQTPADAVARRIADAVLPARDRPAALAVPEASDAFRAAYEVHSVGEAEAPEPASLSRLFPPPVQAALVGAADLVASVEARGDVVRVQAAQTEIRRPYRELLALAESLAAHWRR
jgi:hypothetical protein